MANFILEPESEKLAEVLSALTGETKSEAVHKALEHRLERLERSRARLPLLTEIAQRAGHLPVLDDRTPDEILGYDDQGLPH